MGKSPTVVENDDPFAAQLLAMIMGLASIMAFRAAMDQYAARLDLQPNAAVVAALIDRQSAKVARQVASGWELSERILSALEEQNSEAPSHESALGRSLRFGRVAAALALLYKNNLIAEGQVRGALGAGAGPAPHFDRLWVKLTAR